MLTPTKTEALIQRVMERGDAWLERIDQLLEGSDQGDSFGADEEKQPELELELEPEEEARP